MSYRKMQDQKRRLNQLAQRKAQDVMMDAVFRAQSNEYLKRIFEIMEGKTVLVPEERSW